ncbi:MAG: hypothetical protein V1702_00075, partial [Candidatus Woesearchaeota archaeon]
FAPDGFKIVAGKRSSEFPDRFADIVRISGDGRLVVTQAEGLHAQYLKWSPDSMHYIYLSPGQGRGIEYAITIVNTETAKRHEIGFAWTAKSPDLAEWAPDSRKIAISDGRTIYIAENGANGCKFLYDGMGAGDIAKLQWQSNSELIFVEGNAVKSINPETLEEKTLALGTDIALSQNRQLLCFLSQGDISAYEPANGTSRNITLSPQEETSFTFLPGGKKMIFVQEENGVQNVSLMGVDGGGFMRLTENSNPLVKYHIK